MECRKCSKAVIKSFRCLKCDAKLCSSDCLIEHSFEHNNSMKQQSIRRSSIKSSFMKFGQILKEVVYDEIYSIKNLEFINNKDKRLLIGSGEFANVYIAKNKINNKYYAVKQIFKSKLNKDNSIIMREILIHRRLIHCNIIRMYSHYEDNENFYIVIIKSK